MIKMSLLLAHSGADHTLQGREHPSFLAEHGLHLALAGVFFLVYLGLIVREYRLGQRRAIDSDCRTR